MKKMVGFTLIEILIVLVIISLLAAISIPLFADYTKRTKAADAWEELTHIATLQEQIFTDFRSFFPGGATTPARLQAYGAKAGYIIGTANAAKYFFIDISNTGGWTATAYLCFDGRASCASGSYDYAFTLNNAGDKTSTKSGGTAQTGWRL